MTLIAVFVVLSLEYYFYWGAEYRSFKWFEFIQDKLEDNFSTKGFWSGWGGVFLVCFSPVLLLWLFLSLFTGVFYSLVLFVTSCIVLFMSIGPHSLTASFKPYFQAMERGDQEAAYLLLRQESLLDDVPESDDLVRNATRLIFIESHNRYFGVIFWFIFLGPFGALFYRLVYQYYASCKQNANDEHLDLLQQLMHWLDWAPARVTSLLFLLTGDFVNGFYRVKDYLVDLAANNQQIVSETGIAALGIDIGMSHNDILENQNALTLIERTMIIYLVVVAALTPFTFW